MRDTLRILGGMGILVIVMGAEVSAAQGLSCGDVYAAAVRNVSVTNRSSAEFDYIYNQHCGRSGELFEASAGIDLTVPIKKIVVGFSGSKTEARQRMESFCKEHHAERSKRSELFQLSNTVVVDALKSFNECRALEFKNVQISHTVADPRTVTVNVSFNPATTNVRLRAVSYDPTSADCRTTAFSEDGKPVLVNANTSEASIPKPFSVVCDRKGVETGSGETRFPRLSLLVDLNHGSYTVTMPIEGLAGYDLASQNKAEVLQLQKQLRNQQTSMQQAIDVLQGRINRAGAELHIVRQGQLRLNPWEHVVCPQDGGDVGAYMASVCGSRRAVLSSRFSVHSGNKCGYSYYAYACMNLD